MENLITKKYDDNYEKTWDNFVENGILGTIYHTRKFINYHPKDRFVDNSLLIFCKEDLICVVPACKKNTKNITYPLIYSEDGDIDIDPREFTTPNTKILSDFSYMGSTYGGPVFLEKYFEIRYVKLIIDKIFEYYNNQIEFRMANNIYFGDNVFTVYSLLSSKLIMKPELSWYIKTNEDFVGKISNKRNKKNLKKMIDNENIKCYHSIDIEDYKLYYDLLDKNLTTRHKTSPTHTKEEFLYLKEILQNNGLLYLVKENNNILGGVYVIKVTTLCWYTFYISKNVDSDNHAAIPYLMYTIGQDAKKEGVKYLDYGISTENKGSSLNEGLADFKERSLGGTSNARFLFLLP